jgi:hypothetical protein
MSWFSDEKNEKKIIADFHVLGLFMTKNMISVCLAPLPPLPLLEKFGSRLQPLPWKLES